MVLMDIFELYNIFLNIINSQQGGHVPPATRFIDWVNEISLQMFNDSFDEAGSLQKGIDQMDFPFLIGTNVALTNVPNRNWDFFLPPKDYAYFSSLRLLKKKDADCGCLMENKNILLDQKSHGWEDPDIEAFRKKYSGSFFESYTVDKVENQAWDSALVSRIKKLSVKKPKSTQADGGFRIAPKNLGVAFLDYYKYPRKALFAYTTSSTGAIQYDLANSVQLDWPRTTLPRFVAALKKKYGSFTSQEQKYKEGQSEEVQAK